jgi:hypothetical protein
MKGSRKKMVLNFRCHLLSSSGFFLSEVGLKMSTRWGDLMGVKRLYLELDHIKGGDV